MIIAMFIAMSVGSCMEVKYTLITVNESETVIDVVQACLNSKYNNDQGVDIRRQHC